MATESRDPRSAPTQAPASSEERRAQRHASRTGRTYAAFIRRLCEVGALEPALAESAAIAVLSALERRIQPEEARQLEAQLPRKLVEYLEASGAPHSGPHRFDRDAFLQTVAEDLRMEPAQVEPIVRSVFAALRDQISPGEVEDVAAQLPQDILSLWSAPH